ncbi:unnamed protein product [Mytilus coruscus]|uniref:Uncharacterized protein n=1 Tax=Mytilus coruscus TaxID=42192 RepID=A0A6J8ACD1_MYTCO|nr:unnamed protein product [Mytilus coruscus]
MPLQLRRGPPFLKYYARTKQNPSNPANQLVEDCIEYQIYNHKWNDHNIPYGFRVQNLLKDNDLDKIKLNTLQELSGSVTQKWSQAVTGSNNSIFTTKTVRNIEYIVKKTNNTARVIRVSDSEMESGRNRQYRRLFKTAQQNIVKKINYTARVIRVSDSEMESGPQPAVQQALQDELKSK